MGLVAKPNVLANSNSKDSSSSLNDASSKKPCIIELFDVPDSDVPKKKMFPLDLEDEKYIARCMSKYGTDYLAMFRDTKVNFLQHTEDKLRKLGARYVLLSPEQRRVDVPDRVKPLLALQEST
jgi:Ribosome biogenesis protein Nop16